MLQENCPLRLNESELSFHASMDALQAERLAILYKSCQRNKPDFHNFSDEPLHNVLYSSRYKVVLFQIVRARDK